MSEVRETATRLVLITCDADGCAASIKPNPDIAASEWVKCGLTGAEAVRYSYCPEHNHLAAEFCAYHDARIAMESRKRQAV